MRIASLVVVSSSLLFAAPAFAQGESRPPLLSTSGTDLAPALAPVTSPQTPSDVGARIRALDARIAELEAKSASPWPAWLDGLRVTGFVQPGIAITVVNAAASPNGTGGVLPGGITPNDVIARSDGTTTNDDFFRIRRSRIMATFAPSKYARFTLELEPLAQAGPTPVSTTFVRQVEATAVLPFADGKARFEVGASVFKVGFGFETQQLDPDRPFLERSFVQRAWFPGDYDMGIRALFAWNKRLRIEAQVLNGRTIGEPDFSLLPDPNLGKDAILRLSYDAGPADFGLSGAYGRGQVIDRDQLRFRQFPRWAIGAEVALHRTFATGLGQTRLLGEVLYGNGMDRGTTFGGAGLPLLPEDIGAPLATRKELGAFVRLEQELGRVFSLGVRWDAYSPDVGLKGNVRHAIAAVLVVRMVRGLQTMIEYDHAWDAIRPGGPSPSTRITDSVFCTLQGRF